jgi:hypothetical protein
VRHSHELRCALWAAARRGMTAAHGLSRSTFTPAHRHRHHAGAEAREQRDRKLQAGRINQQHAVAARNSPSARHRVCDGTRALVQAAHREPRRLSAAGEPHVQRVIRPRGRPGAQTIQHRHDCQRHGWRCARLQRTRRARRSRAHIRARHAPRRRRGAAPVCPPRRRACGDRTGRSSSRQASRCARAASFPRRKRIVSGHQTRPNRHMCSCSAPRGRCRAVRRRCHVHCTRVRCMHERAAATAPQRKQSAPRPIKALS